MTVDQNETRADRTPCDRPEQPARSGCSGCLGICEPRRDDWLTLGA